MIGIVYFIQESETKRIKIGKTKTPSSLLERFKTFQAGNSQEIRIISLKHGFTSEEGRLHKLFKGNHYRGEWHELDEILEAFIRDNNNKNHQFIEEVVGEQPLLKLLMDRSFGLIEIGDVNTYKEEYLVLQTVNEFIDAYGFFHLEMLKGQKFFKNYLKIKPKANYDSLAAHTDLIEKEHGCVWIYPFIEGKKRRLKVYGDVGKALGYLKK